MEVSDMSIILSHLPEETLKVMGDSVHEFLNTRPDIDTAVTGIELKAAIIEAEQRQRLRNETVTLRVKSVQPAFRTVVYGPGGCEGHA